jgi:hypothetical protein
MRSNRMVPYWVSSRIEGPPLPTLPLMVGLSPSFTTFKLGPEKSLSTSP